MIKIKIIGSKIRYEKRLDDNIKTDTHQFLNYAKNFARLSFTVDF